jgi:hypothetical protein
MCFPRFLLGRRGALLFVGLFGAFPALSASPEWATETIEEIWEFPRSERIMKAEASRMQQLQGESDVVLQRIRVKEMILDDIEMGRLTLAEAANRFRAMDAERPEIAAILYPPERLGSADEIAATSVIRHMGTRFAGGRPLVAGTMSRLVGDFERAYGYDPTKDGLY